MLTLTIHLNGTLESNPTHTETRSTLGHIQGQLHPRNLKKHHLFSPPLQPIDHQRHPSSLTLRNRNPTDRSKIPHNKASKIHLQNPTNRHLMKSKTMNPHTTDCLKTQIRAYLHHIVSKIHLQDPANSHLIYRSKTRYQNLMNRQLMKSKTMNPHPTDRLKT